MRSPVMCRPTPIMDSTVQVTNTLRNTKQSLKWGAINGILLAIVLYDLSNPCPYYPLWLSCIEVGIAIVLIVSLIFHICCYIWNSLNIQPVTLTSEQMKLLGIKKTDPYFNVSTPKDTSKIPPSPDASTDLLSATPMNFSATSWLSTSFLTSGRSDSTSPNLSMSATSWEYIPASPLVTYSTWDCAPTSPITFTSSGSPVHSPPQCPPIPNIVDLSNFSNISCVEAIEDEKSLSKFLQEFKDYEHSLGIFLGAPTEQTSQSLDSWKNSPTRIESNVVVSPVSCTYQLSCPSPVPSPGSPGGMEGGSPSLQKHRSMELWRRLRVKPSTLTQWNANLRQWISQTVLERLVQEINSVDEAFQRHGLTDMKIGFVGLERLKKTALIAQVVQNIPTLPHVVKFLEVSSNQEYTVSRLKDLAKGGCMSDFRWNSGGSLHGKEWVDHLPTDSALVMHLVASYLDTQLLPLPHSTYMRPFSSEYLVKYPEKLPSGKTTPVIQELQLNPPHYVFVAKGDKFEVEMGRNNLFHTFLLFLHYMKTKEAGMLGRINLGPSGINLLWVIES